MQTDADRFAALKRLATRQGAIIALHWSIGAHEAQYIPGQLALLGGTRGGPQRKYKVIENDVHLAEAHHPIVRGLHDFRIKDEFYYRLDLVPPSPQSVTPRVAILGLERRGPFAVLIGRFPRAQLVVPEDRLADAGRYL